MQVLQKDAELLEYVLPCIDSGHCCDDHSYQDIHLRSTEGVLPLSLTLSSLPAGAQVRGIVQGNALLLGVHVEYQSYPPLQV